MASTVDHAALSEAKQVGKLAVRLLKHEFAKEEVEPEEGIRNLGIPLSFELVCMSYGVGDWFHKLALTCVATVKDSVGQSRGSQEKDLQGPFQTLCDLAYYDRQEVGLQLISYSVILINRARTLTTTVTPKLKFYRNHYHPLHRRAT